MPRSSSDMVTKPVLEGAIRSGGSIQAAANALGLEYPATYRMARRMGINVKSLVNRPSRGRSAANSAMTWSGKLVSFSNPQVEQIDIRDIAEGLAHTFRFNAQSDGKISVAEHSINVGIDCLASGGVRAGLVGLMHDAPEYVIGDIVSPLKNMLGPTIRRVESRIGDAIADKFGFLEAWNDPAVWEIVDEVDRYWALVEGVTAKMDGYVRDDDGELVQAPRRWIPNHVSPHPRRITFLDPPTARAEFLRSFETFIKAYRK